MSFGPKFLISHSPAPDMQSGCHESSMFGTAREDDTDDGHSTLEAVWTILYLSPAWTCLRLCTHILHQEQFLGREIGVLR